MSAPQALVLRALGLGDLLVAVPALRGLRRGLPEHRITLAAPRVLEPLVRLSGAVDDVLHSVELAPLPPAGPVDVAVDLHGCNPESHDLLRPARPRRLLAFAHPGSPDIDGPAWNPDEHEARRWCRLVSSYGFPADPDDLDLPAPPRASPAPGAVVVHPGAAFPSRRWPVERFAAVAAALRDDGHRVVVTGGQAETAIARKVVELAGLAPDADLSGRTDLLDLAALIAGARLVVSGDTGTGHLATAYRTPSVLLFGPTPPAWWGPPPDRPQHRVLWAGRRGDPHGGSPDPGLLEISTADALGAARRTLAGTARSQDRLPDMEGVT
ncbi:glycosyltransferase family 9 protein [Actinomadura hibisca]|uniref:glycosyltransferase family 9 protein n=1 Tax=Actinomadura hibisca TaxID=68565 RepID=UPI000AB0C301|nr:glycosyltransferase family 9 protein [Actinomadura hibisca]